MAVALGAAAWDGQSLTWTSEGGQMEIAADALRRLRRVDDDPEGLLLGASFAVTLSVGPLPDGAEESGDWVKTGLRWPGLWS